MAARVPGIKTPEAFSWTSVLKMLISQMDRFPLPAPLHCQRSPNATARLYSSGPRVAWLRRHMGQCAVCHFEVSPPHPLNY